MRLNAGSRDHVLALVGLSCFGEMGLMGDECNKDRGRIGPGHSSTDPTTQVPAETAAPLDEQAGLREERVEGGMRRAEGPG